VKGIPKKGKQKREIIIRNFFSGMHRFSLRDILTITRQDVKKVNCFSLTAPAHLPSIMLLRRDSFLSFSILFQDMLPVVQCCA